MAPKLRNLRWGLCVVGDCTPKDGAHKVYAVHVYVHHLHTDRTYSYHLRQQSAIPLSSRLFHDTRVSVLGCVMVAGPETT